MQHKQLPRKNRLQKAIFYAKVTTAVAAGAWLSFQPLASPAQVKSATQQKVASAPAQKPQQEVVDQYYQSALQNPSISKFGANRQDTIFPIKWRLNEGDLFVKAPGTRFGGGVLSLSSYVKGMTNSPNPSSSDVREAKYAYQENVGPCIYLFFDYGVIQVSIEKYSGRIKVRGPPASKDPVFTQEGSYIIARNGSLIAVTKSEIIAILPEINYKWQSSDFRIRHPVFSQPTDDGYVFLKDKLSAPTPNPTAIRISTLNENDIMITVPVWALPINDSIKY